MIQKEQQFKFAAHMYIRLYAYRKSKHVEGLINQFNPDQLKQLLMQLFEVCKCSPSHMQKSLIEN